jgi:tRNA threonylcarbamoyladenosine biosynthesis protein TsaE
MLPGIYFSHSAEETHQLGETFGQMLSANAIVAFFGDLGAGKTTFVRGLVEGIGGVDLTQVCSPTFTFLNIYTGNKPLYHFDLYRLPRQEEFFAAGFEEYFHAGGICCLEWAEKIESLLPPNSYHVLFSYLNEGCRRIEIKRGTQ